MQRVYQASSLNMGWCINCHVNGYDPKEGQKARRLRHRDSPPTTAGGVPDGTPRYDCAGIMPLLSRQGRRGAAGATPHASPLPFRVARRRARYDCASCH